MTTLDYALLQLFLTSLIIVLGWLVQAVALIRIWTNALSMNLAWKCTILLASLFMLGPPAMDLFCIFAIIFRGDLATVEQAREN